MRLDLYLVEKSYFATRQKAKYAIEDGYILVNNKIIYKTSYNVEESDLIIVKNRAENYVSRGGYKLSKALKEFNINVSNKICLDIGQSTGGFTDCLLQNNAKFVYGIEVGIDQLDKSMINNNKIKTLEKTNFKDLKPEQVNNTMFDIVSVDVSFISLSNIWPNLTNFVDFNTYIIALIKPQFENYESAYKHKGFISSKEDHLIAINNVIKSANLNGFYLHNLTFSPILGEKKENIEFLGLFRTIKNENIIKIEEIIEKAHKELK